MKNNPPSVSVVVVDDLNDIKHATRFPSLKY